MAQQSVTGSGQPVLTTVPQEHAKGDVAPIRELPYGPAATCCSEGRTDGSTRLRTTLTNRLHLKGRPQMVCGHLATSGNTIPERRSAQLIVRLMSDPQHHLIEIAASDPVCVQAASNRKAWTRLALLDLREKLTENRQVSRLDFHRPPRRPLLRRKGLAQGADDLLNSFYHRSRLLARSKVCNESEADADQHPTAIYTRIGIST